LSTDRSGPAVIIIDTDDVVLPQIASDLAFDQFQQKRAGILDLKSRKSNWFWMRRRKPNPIAMMTNVIPEVGSAIFRPGDLWQLRGASSRWR
jgi:hypothetical protein